MSLFSKKKICVTHNGAFHADDLFATATLSILNNGNIKIIRTRDPEIFKTADYLYDVGGENDPENDKFDHHQKEGAGKRNNGIPYAAFGLVWKKYGEQICGSKEVADIIDSKLVCSIDAIDNGMDVVKSLISGVSVYSVGQLFLIRKPTWEEGEDKIDDIFEEQVKEIEKFLLREIEVTKADVKGKNILMKAYNEAQDKRIIIIDVGLPRYLYQDVLSQLKEPMFVILPSNHSDLWKAEAVTVSPETLASRKLFPESWRGLNGEVDIEKASGVIGANFCHRTGFLAIAKSKEGAIELAEKALLS